MDSTTLIDKKVINWWDWLGVFFSSLCVIHCVATPILLAGASLWIASEWVHIGFLIALVPIVFLALKHSHASHHGKRGLVILFNAGLVFLVSAILFGEALGEGFEVGLTIVGSILLISGHLRNRYLNNQAK